MNPIRCCVVCRKRKEKAELFRIVSDKKNNAIVDRLQNINTRGIYICKEETCIENFKKSLQKRKAKLKIDINVDSLLNVLDELGEEIWEN